MTRAGFITVGRAFTARLARRKAAPYVSYEAASTYEAVQPAATNTTVSAGAIGLTDTNAGSVAC